MINCVSPVHPQSQLEAAPARLLQLEFHLPEETFLRNVEVAENTITQEKTQLQHNVPLAEVLALHRVRALEYLSVVCQENMVFRPSSLFFPFTFSVERLLLRFSLNPS